MRNKREYVILTFRTTTDAMAMEAQCAEQSIPGRLIPIPREITAGCGLAWRIAPEQYAQNKDAIFALHIPFEQMVSLKI
jgi:hypothetical protein